jgi:hypothetical protein
LLRQNTDSVVDDSPVQAVRSRCLTGERQLYALQLHQKSIIGLSEDWSPLNVEEVHAVFESDHCTENRCLASMLCRRPFPGPCGSILEEVDAIAKPVIFIPAEPKPLS